MIVARRLKGIKKIIVTRLPPGHTHEVSLCFLLLIATTKLQYFYKLLKDIDAKFALIWKKMRLTHVGTPEQAKRLFLAALRTVGMDARVIDLFAVPDYAKWFEDSGVMGYVGV